MTDKQHSPSSVLGSELTDALDRSLQTSLHSLSSLRHAVRSYTLHERNRGVSLENLLKEALTTLTDAEDDRGDLSNLAPVRDGELARQLQAWCREDFGRRS